MSRFLRYLTLFQLASLLILLCMWVFPQFYITTKLLLSVFISSRSSFKYYLFFVFLFIVSSLWKTRKWRCESKSCAELVLPIAVLFLFLLAFAEYVYLAMRFDFPVLELRGFYGNGDLSNSSLFHLHTGKVVVGAVTQFFVSDEFRYAYDSGMSFLKFFPSWLVLLHGFIAIVFVLSLVRSLATQALPPKGLVLPYVISAFTILKNVFDGGIFFHETAIALPLFLAVTTLPPHVVRRNVRNILIATGISTIVSVWVGLLFGMTPDLLISLYIPIILFYIVLSLTELWFVNGKYFRGLAFAPLCLLLFYVIAAHTNTISTFGVSSFRYAKTEVGAAQEVFLVQHNPIGKSTNQLVKVIEEREYLGVYLYVLRALKHFKLTDLNLSGSNINYYEASFPGIDCDSRTLFHRKYWLTLDSPALLSNGAFEGALSWSIEEVAGGAYVLDVQHRGCLPLPLEWMLLILKEMKVDSAVIQFEQSY